jgi:hypothetical protein
MHAAGGLGAGTAPGTSDRYPESPDWPALELELSTRYRCPRPETAGHQFGGLARPDLQVLNPRRAPGPSRRVMTVRRDVVSLGRRPARHYRGTG